MINFWTLQIKGFGVFSGDKQVVSLHDRGSILVIGENNDTRAAESNGSGKSTLFNAISWCLYGETIYPIRTDQIINRNEKECEVKVTFDDDVGEKWRIVRTRKGKDGRTGEVRLEHHDAKKSEWEDYSRHKGKDTQQGIIDLLEMDWDAFRCTVLFGQGDRARFASPSMTDAGRKSVLRSVLKTDKYDEAQTRCKDIRADAKTTLKWETDKLEELHRDISIKDNKIAKLDGEIEVLTDTLKSGEDEIDDLEVYLVDVELASDISKKVIDRENEELALVDDDIEEFREHLTKFTGKVEMKRREVEAFTERVEELSTEGPCPECGQERPFDKEKHEKVKTELEEARKTYAKLKTLKSETDQALRDARADKTRLLKSIAAAEEEFELHKREASQIEGKIEAIKKQIASATEQIEERKPKIEKLKDELSDLWTEVKKVEELKNEQQKLFQLADWWVSAFGPKGVPAFAIEQSLPLINSIANKHLLELSDGDISVRWTATAEGKTKGVTKEELTQNVTIEGNEGVNPSGGQQKKIELATEVALSELQREIVGCNLIMFDEAFDGLDAEGRSRVAQWINTLPQKSRFVIAHDREMVGSFDGMLKVVKTDGASVVEAL